MATSLFDLNNLNGSNGFVIRGTTQDDRLGTKVDLSGDINGDGIEDIAIGTINGGDSSTDPYSYNYSDRRGETYVIFGNDNLNLNSSLDLNDLNGNNGFRVSGVNEDDNLGNAISLGDLNGDGIDDLAIGAPYGGSRTTNYGYEYGRGEGRAYVIFGRRSGFTANVDLSSLDGNDGFSLGGIDAQDNLGMAIASAGDLNGDGIDDLAVSATGAGQTITNSDGYSYSDRRGETYIIFGRDDSNFEIDLALLDGSDGFKIEGKDANDRLGQNLSNAGDINGDGIDDLVIGTPAAGEIRDSPYAYGDSDRRGETYIIFGSNNGFNSTLDLDNLNGSNGFTISGVGIEDNLGSAVTNAGDINGDGINDLVLGAQEASQTGEYTFEGGAYVVFGKNTGFDAQFDLTTLDGSNGFSIPGLELDDNLGNAVSVGDIDGDGIDDVIVGANTAGQTITANDGYEYSDLRGEAYIIYGKNSGFDAAINLASLSSLDGGKITGIGADDLLGSAIGSGGDVNNDDREDLILSAPDDDVRGEYTREGKAYVVFISERQVNRIVGTPQNDSIEGTNNREEILGLSGDDTINGRGGNDIVRGAEGNDSLMGGSGNDLLDGNGGNDTLIGDRDNDTLIGSSGNDLLRDNSGDNILSGGSGLDSLYGGNGRDVLRGGNGQDLILGGTNDDSLSGNGSRDMLFGEAGNDTLDGGSAQDTLDGGIGDDLLIGNSEADRLVGNEGNDILDGGDDNDTLIGNQGDDILQGNQGRDRLNGGNGNDSLSGGSGEDILLGNEGNDTINGNEQSDRLGGALGEDVLNGGDGDDTLIGNLDNDVLSGGNGNDVLQGGAGNDLLMGADDLDSLNGGNGEDTLLGGDGQDTLFGGNNSDSLDGNNNADRIDGENGEDILVGGFGNDTLFGGIGDDSLNGEGDNDVLDATKSDSTNFGLSELDTLTGGAGSDIFTLGDDGEVYYDDGISNTKGINDFALINDLDVDRDIIKLMGRENQYELNIYANGLGSFNAEVIYNPEDYTMGELIGVLENVPSDLNLSDPLFSII